MTERGEQWLQKTLWLGAECEANLCQPECLWYRGILPWRWSWGLCKSYDWDEPLQFETGEHAEGNDLFLDGAGPSKYQDVPKFAQKVGAGAISIG